jgi:hypothetical protein
MIVVEAGVLPGIRQFNMVHWPTDWEVEEVYAAGAVLTGDDRFTRRVRATRPGAMNAIRALHSEGYRLCTTSGEDLEDLGGYLEGMWVRDLFERLYGPDLVNMASPPFFYREKG